MAVHFLDLGDERLGTGHVAETPTRHGVRLGESVEDQCPLGHSRQRGNARVCLAVIEDLLVHLVREDKQVMLVGEIGNRLQLRRIQHAARRVVWRIQEQDARGRRHCRVQRLRGHTPVVVRVRAPRALHGHRPVRPSARRRPRPVPGSGRRRRDSTNASDRLEERLLAARRNNDAAHGVNLDLVVMPGASARSPCAAPEYPGWRHSVCLRRSSTRWRHRGYALG